MNAIRVLSRFPFFIIPFLGIISSLYARPIFISIDRTDSALVHSLENKTRTDLDTKFQLQYGKQSVSSEVMHPDHPSGYRELNDSTTDIFSRARSALTKVKETSNYLRNITEKTRLELPLGINKTISGNDYTLIIDRIYVTNTGTFMDVFLSLQIPYSETPLVFFASDIPFSASGGIPEGTQISLVEDFAFSLPGNKLHFVLKGGEQKTNVRIGCEGFESLSVHAELRFSSNTISSTDAENREVIVSVSAETQDWNDLIFKGELPAFQVEKLKDFSFGTTEISVDMSDFRNTFTETSDLPNTWRGVHAKSVELYFPNTIKRSIEASSPKIVVQDLLIGSSGLSMETEVFNILPLNEGNVSGWNFSINEFYLKVNNNILTNIRWSGNILTPLNDKDKPIAYQTKLSSEGNIELRANFPNQMNFSLWKGSVLSIDDNSYISINRSNGLWAPELVIYGSTEINLNVKGRLIELGEIYLEALSISSTENKLHLNGIHYDYSQASSLGKFPLQLEKLSIKVDEQSFVLTEIDAGISLGEAGKFSGKTSIQISSKLDRAGNRLQWITDDIKVEYIELHASHSAFSMDGYLELRRDSLESSCAGRLNVKIDPGIEVKSTVVFGKKADYNFWYFDGLAEFQQGIPFMGNLALYGFGGGAYKNVMVDQETVNGLPSYEAGTDWGSGFKAIVILGSSPGKEKFQGSLILSMNFAPEGGIRDIGLKGTAQFAVDDFSQGLSQLSQMKSKLQAKVGAMEDRLESSALGSVLGHDDYLAQDVTSIASEDDGMRAYLNLKWDRTNSVLQGDFEIFVNLARTRIIGRGEGGRAGWGQLYFGPDDWFIHIGTPQDRLGLILDAELFTVEASGYFMAGKTIPALPPIPQNISELLETSNKSSINSVNGSGFIFGAQFRISTGDMEFMIFYGSFDLNAGFDLLFTLNQFNSCSTSAGNWNASGHAYAYVSGLVGIKLDLFGSEQRIDILKVTAAALLTASVPDPLYFTAQIGGEFEILGGLIKGKCNFQIKIGDTCEETTQNSALDVELVQTSYPLPDSRDVPLSIIPSIQFKIPVDQPFSVISEGEIVKYRMHIIDISLFLDGIAVSSVLNSNELGDIISVYPDNALAPQTSYTLKAKLEMQTFEDGSWAAANKEKPPVLYNLRFQTGAESPEIQLTNLKHSYPVFDSQYFHPDDSKTGFIDLVQGQSTLLGNSDLKVAFIANDFYWETAATYHKAEKRIEYLIPESLPLNSAIDLNLFLTQNSTDSLESNKILLLSANFKTSQFRTFDERFANWSIKSASPYLIKPGVHHIQLVLSGTELPTSKELKQLTLLTDNSSFWYKEDIKKSIYFNESILLDAVDHRDPSEERVPLKTISYSTPDTQWYLTDKISEIAFLDLMDLKSWTAAMLLSDSEVDTKILHQSFPALRLDKTYTIRFQRKLPGFLDSPIYALNYHLK